MSKSQYSNHTSAVRSAASGTLKKHNAKSGRATSVYGFSNHALKKTGDELKDAWRGASASMKSN